MSMESYLFSVICLSAIVQLQSITRFSLPSSSFRKKIKNSRLDFLSGMPLLSDCAKECYYVRRCASFQFNQVHRECLLNKKSSSQLNTDDLEEDSKFIFSNKKDWPKVIAGSCADEPCSMKEKCVPGRMPTCIPYCGDVPMMYSAMRKKSICRHVGCVVKHKCKDRFVASTTDMRMTCQENWTWTWPFLCIPHCGTPPNVTNAVAGSGLETQDAIRSYSCQEPYVATPNSTTITCQANSNWTEPQFQCREA